MIKALLDGTYGTIRLRHVPLVFSRELHEVGRLRFAKLLQLPFVVVRIWWARLRFCARVLYYPPAGPNMVPVLRDIVILLLTRPFFPVTVFHFHAGGLGAFIQRLPIPMRLLARAAYGRPDLVIRLSAATPNDGTALGARAEAIIPYGIADLYPDGPPPRLPLVNRPARLLFVGALRPTKGVLIAVDAVRRLLAAGHDVTLDLVGDPISVAFAEQLRSAIEAAGLGERVRLRGVLTGAAKDAVYAAADIFCFPTFYEAEAFSVVVIEAMLHALPVVATRWRGLTDLVAEGVSGLLVPPCDPQAVADAVAVLLTDPAQLQRMGAAGRALYLERYTLAAYRARLEAALVAARGVISRAPRWR
ncbi:MAG: glycosyltransferase family 4 protein [Chloroflexi bacterium]|nr:glycosyltransferase family 4 protein [Chloroflexota bacterium]